MRVERLVFAGARNLSTFELAPAERFNVFVGDNGQGKTNLLEAIYVVATLRSFRTARLTDLIAFGQEEARIGARLGAGDSNGTYEVEISRTGRRARLDGKLVRPRARYFGEINLVAFTPEDLGLARAPP